MNAIEICGLVKRFGALTAVNGLTLDAAQGEALALLGVNGAGKTTAIRILSGLLPADGGTASIMGHPAGTTAAKACLGLSPQETAVAENLTVRENLTLMARIHGMNAAEARRAADDLIDRLSLAQVVSRRAKKLSGGWQRRLSIAMALISRPDVLILDEPTLGLDVLARRELWSVIRDLHGRTTLLLTTHYLPEAEELCDRMVILNRGKIAASGTPAQIRGAEETMEDAYLRLIREVEV